MNRIALIACLSLVAPGAAHSQIMPAPKDGEPNLTWRQVVVITERQSEACEYVNQRTCKTSRTTEKCVDSHRDHAAKAGANAIMLLMTNTGGFSLFGKDTTMLANYYKCPVKTAPDEPPLADSNSPR